MRRAPDTGFPPTSARHDAFSPLSHQHEMIGRPVGIHIPKAVILAKSKNPGHSVVWSLATPPLFLGDPPIRGSGSGANTIG